MTSKIKQYCLSFWAIIDPLYFSLTRLHHIENNCGERTIMRVRLTKYRGRKVVLSDGTIINRNDLLLKIHLHNVKLLRQFQGHSEIRKALITYKSVRESLPFISRYLQFHKKANKIKGIIGITTLDTGYRKLCFESFPIQNRYYKLLRQLSQSLIYLLSADNILKRAYPTPRYLLMSKNDLLSKYNQGS